MGRDQSSPVSFSRSGFRVSDPGFRAKGLGFRTPLNYIIPNMGIIGTLQKSRFW